MYVTSEQLKGIDCSDTAACVMPLADAPGGQEQVEKAYTEALSACFDLEVEVHQHVQPYKSSKDGSLKWALLEMWPLLVSA